MIPTSMPMIPQTRFCRKTLLHQPALRQTSFYTKNIFYANQLCDRAAFTQTSFAPINFYKPVFTQISFNHFTQINAALHKPSFKQPTFTQTYANHSLHQPASTTQLLHDQPLHQPALHNPCFGPVGQRRDGRRNECWRLLNMSHKKSNNPAHVWKLKGVNHAAKGFPACTQALLSCPATDEESGSAASKQVPTCW